MIISFVCPYNYISLIFTTIIKYNEGIAASGPLLLLKSYINLVV